MPKEDREERRLIERTQGGEIDAFSQLVDLYRSQIIGFLAVRLPAATDVEDLAQEVFITAFRKIGGYSHDHRFGAWLRGIATNYARNYLRKHRAVPIGGNAELDALIHSGIETRPWTSEPEVYTRLEECLEELTPASQELIRLRYTDRATNSEIGEALARSEGAVKMHLMRARRLIADCLTRREGYQT